MLYPKNRILFSTLKKWVIKSQKEMGKSKVLFAKRNQYEKATYCMIQIIWHSGKRQNYNDGKNKSLPTHQDLA